MLLFWLFICVSLLLYWEHLYFIHDHCFTRKPLLRAQNLRILLRFWVARIDLCYMMKHFFSRSVHDSCSFKSVVNVQPDVQCIRGTVITNLTDFSYVNWVTVDLVDERRTSIRHLGRITAQGRWWGKLERWGVSDKHHLWWLWWWRRDE